MTKRGGKTNNPQRPLRVTAQQPAPAPGRYQPRLLREYRSKAERDAVLQRYLILGTIAIVAVLALVLAVAFIVDGVIRPRQAVANVNGTPISVAQFENRVRLERALINERVNQGFQLYQSIGYSQDQAIQQLEQQQPYAGYISEIQVADQLGNRVLNDMIQDELIRQEAAARGITVTDEQIEEQIEPLFGYDPEEGLYTATPSPEPTTTPTPFVSPTPSSTPPPTATATPETTLEATQDAAAPTATLTITPAPSNTPAPTPDATQRAADYQTDRADYFGQLRALAGVSDSDIRAYYEVQALREQLRDFVGAEIGATGQFVNARHILVGTETEAQDVLTALQNGESFAELARVVSTDTGSGANGGELDWNPATQYVLPFAEAVRTAEIGALVGPVQTDFGYHVIQVRAREDRELTEDQQNSAKDQALSEYLETLRDADTTNVEIFDIWTSNVPDEPALRLR